MSDAMNATDEMEQISLSMSNFDYSIDDGLAEALQARPGEVSAHHAAWNFSGRVWFADGKFHEEVWVYGFPQKTLSAETLPDLMALACDEFGYD